MKKIVIILIVSLFFIIPASSAEAIIQLDCACPEDTPPGEAVPPDPDNTSIPSSSIETQLILQRPSPFQKTPDQNIKMKNSKPFGYVIYETVSNWIKNFAN